MRSNELVMNQHATHPILGRRILLVTAHPDDESYVCAGTLARNAGHGGTTAIFCATQGERGTAHLRRPMTPHALARRRCRELRAAGRVLNVRRLTIGNLPDGALDRHMEKFYRGVLAEARQVKPDVIAGFGPCGVTGHRDHIAASTVARRAAVRLRLPFAAAVLPTVVQRSARAFLISRRRSPHYTRSIRFLQPNLTIPIESSVKHRAVACHRSQMDGPRTFTGFPAYVVRALVTREYFRVWRPR